MSNLIYVINGVAFLVLMGLLTHGIYRHRQFTKELAELDAILAQNDRMIEENTRILEESQAHLNQLERERNHHEIHL